MRTGVLFELGEVPIFDLDHRLALALFVLVQLVGRRVVVVPVSTQLLVLLIQLGLPDAQLFQQLHVQLVIVVAKELHGVVHFVLGLDSHRARAIGHAEERVAEVLKDIANGLFVGVCVSQ